MVEIYLNLIHTFMMERFLDVITSIADMKVSEIIAMPKNMYTSATKYETAKENQKK